MRARILSKLEDNWSEIVTEYQCMDVNDLFKDELKEMDSDACHGNFVCKR